MKSLGLIFFIYLTVINLTNSTPTSNYSVSDKLKVEVYYEPATPESVKFIRKQLYLTIKAYDWLPFIDLEFIPYGKVHVFPDGWIFCKPATCDSIALHACIVEHNSVEEQLEMVNCLLEWPYTFVDTCAQRFNIDISAAKNCKNTRTNVDILDKYAGKMHANNITSVPSVALGGHFDPSKREDILTRFSEEFCRKYRDTFAITLDDC